MAAEKRHFKISTGLKDLIGRELITDDFVAVFELVKNAYDAHAKGATVYFGQDRIVVFDDGKGMSRDDILNKWLFVAYSAKRDGTEDATYRDKIGTKNRPFAGAKGVGRFSCDRLGSLLTLSSKAEGHRVQVLKIDWQDYEHDPHEEFGDIEVELSEARSLPTEPLPPLGPTGTILDVSTLRSEWPREKLQRLKRELGKLINPFQSRRGNFKINVVAPTEIEADKIDRKFNLSRRSDQPTRQLVNGLVENEILDVLRDRTTVVRVRLAEDGTKLETELEDRGELIYRIREPNPYPGLATAQFAADIYYLNRGAKVLFAHRMGLPSVQFGSIFLFRNGFRVFPIGETDDDFFGLNQRKQQGVRRFLGGRDLIGRVEVAGVEGFDEATSRNQGLIRTPKVQDLIDCVRDKCVRRLERYVVDITWKDRFDKDEVTSSRMLRDESSSRVAELVSRLSATEGVELLRYNPNIVRIVDEKSDAFEQSLKALELLADRTGDDELVARVEEARARIDALQKAEAEARDAELRAEQRAQAAESAVTKTEESLVQERQRNQFLVSAASLDQDTILNLHHQIAIHAADVHHDVKRMMRKLRTGDEISNADWTNFLERVSFRNSQILTAARFATKAGYRQQSADVKADLAAYVVDYIETLATLWAPRGISLEIATDGKPFERRFKPIEIGIVVDNLISNSAKARATKVQFILETKKTEFWMTVSDDGQGWSSSLPSNRAFEKGTTTTDGSGLGLFHVKQIIEGMGGSVETLPEGPSGELDGAALRFKVPS